MEDYPTNQLEFEARFSDEEACRECLARVRWPDGFRCPSCGHAGNWVSRRGLSQCSGCGRQTSVTAGTVFQDTRLPLRLWFRAMWAITGYKHGVGAMGLQRVLGMKRYETVWTWLHKLRAAMVRPGRERLSGTVEVDETYVGGVRAGKRGRGAEGKALVVVAVEDKGGEIGRVRLRRVADASADSLTPFITRTWRRGAWSALTGGAHKRPCPSGASGTRSPAGATRWGTIFSRWPTVWLRS